MPEERTNGAERREDDLIHRLFVQEYASMLRTAEQVLGDHGLAETAVQESFMAALRFREKLDASEKPVGWLYRALQYTIKHIQRERRALLLHTLPLEAVPEEDTARCDEYDLLEDQWKEEKDMRLLRAFYVEGYSIRELAEREGISVGACKMRLKRARDRLREKLK